MKRLKEYNVLLNDRKCEFRVPETEFIGLHLSKEGVTPKPEKVEIIMNLRAPASSEEIRSFLGLVGYLGRFIPDLATKTFRLRSLMTKKGAFEWLSEHEEDYRALKVIKKNALNKGLFKGFFFAGMCSKSPNTRVL